ncbi:MULTISPECIES: plasmid partitioning protein [Micrococcaceae]|uniref:plasmid partitioning protein n=1 Tax=unclassified Kocuria TaxID=2649579 RepID=UPI00101156EB|nr:MULTISPECIES: plasmid partitioning protein [unclassified Kocuria]
MISSHFHRSLMVLWTVVGVLLLGITASSALPPGGAKSSTQGTSSSVSPGMLKAGDTIHFTLTGFPKNEQVYVKIDNGNACPADAAQGACVVHQQKSDGSGRVDGSFILPKDLKDGKHTLRFLATELLPGKGSKGFTNISPEFTTAGVNQNSSGGHRYNVTSEDILSGGTRQDAGSGDHAANHGGNGEGSSGNGQGPNLSQPGEQTGGAGENGRGDDAIEYVDADGHPISKEEYDRLMAGSSGAGDESGSEHHDGAENKNAESGKSDDAKDKSKRTATASPGATAKKTGGHAENASTETKKDSVEFPWVGTIAFVVMALIAATVWYVRRRRATTQKS